ncbi:CPL (NUC119) domain [Paramecium bursaria]
MIKKDIKERKVNEKQQQTNNYQAGDYKTQRTPQHDLLNKYRSDIQILIQHRNTENILKTNTAAKLYEIFSGIMMQIAQTKFGGRVIQLLIKCSELPIREQIFNQLMSEKNFAELLKSRYGHYIGITMIRNMVPQYKKQFFEILRKEAPHFITQPDASVVLDRFLIRLATPSQISLIKSQFSEVGEKTDNYAMKIIERGLHKHIISLYILKIALPNLVKEERDKVVEYFQTLENLDYINYKDGVSIRNRESQFSKVSANNFTIFIPRTHFYLGLMKLIHTIDDTKAVNQAILDNIKDEWITNNQYYQIVASVFIPKYNELSQYEISIKDQYSLKDKDIRLQELQNYLYDAVFNKLKEQMNLVTDPNLSKFLAGFIRFIVTEQKIEALPFLKGVMNQLTTQTSKVIYKQDQEQFWILTNPDAQRLAKSLLILESHIENDKFKQLFTEFQTKILNLLMKNLSITLQTCAIYLLIALIEETQLAEKVKFDLKKNKDLLKLQNPGMSILSKLI